MYSLAYFRFTCDNILNWLEVVHTERLERATYRTYRTYQLLHRLEGLTSPLSLQLLLSPLEVLGIDTAPAFT